MCRSAHVHIYAEAVIIGDVSLKRISGKLIYLYAHVHLSTYKCKELKKKFA